MLLAPKTPLFYLFAICVLVSLTAAAPSTQQFRRRNSIAPNSTISSPIQKRQTTSREIIHRRNIKKRLEMARQVKEGCKPTQEPQASGKPYPTCYAEGGKVGYARYANWYVSATGVGDAPSQLTEKGSISRRLAWQPIPFDHSNRGHVYPTLYGLC